jgi:hypothetical protein
MRRVYWVTEDLLVSQEGLYSMELSEVKLVRFSEETVITLRYRRLSPRLKRIFPSSGLLRALRWFDTEDEIAM